MTVADDFGVPLVPEGSYAVVDPDPGAGGRWTLWSTRRGRLRDFPEGTRWRPVAPRFEGLVGAVRRARVDDWYATTYWPWRRDVAEAVLADLVAAEAAFHRVWSSVPLPDPPRWGGGDRVARPRVRVTPLKVRGAESEAVRRRREERTLATVLASAGKSVREIALELGVSKSTAHRRAQGPDGLPASDAVARALLLLKVGDLEAAYRQSAPGVADDQRAGALADLDRIRGILRAGMGT